MTYEFILIVVSLLLLLSVVASKISSFTGIPALLIFLCIGMLAGSDGPGGIYFDNPSLAQSLGVTSLIFILFSGGLDTRWPAIRPVLWPGLSLSTLGTLLTTLFVACFAILMLDFTLLEGLLLGAIVSPTDAAAVFMTMRSKETSLREKLKSLIEFESGSNDPMAVFLTTLMIQVMAKGDGLSWSVLPKFLQQMIVGGIFGLIYGKIFHFFMQKLNLQVTGLFPVFTTAMVLLNYGLCELVGGNGFLSIYISAIILGNQPFAYKKEILNFHDGLAWLMQIIMFLTLGLLVFPKRLIDVSSLGLFFSFFLILMARPMAVFLSLWPFRFSLREKVMVSWLGLRGAVPIILATYPLLAGMKRADMIFNLVFFIVLTSALIQGPFISFVARRLKVLESRHG